MTYLKEFENVSAMEIIDEYGQYHTVILQFADDGGRKVIPHVARMNLTNIGTSTETRGGRGSLYEFAPGIRNFVLIRERVEGVLFSFFPRRRLMSRNYYRNSYSNESDDSESRSKSVQRRGI